MSEFTQNITNPFPDNNMLFDASKVAAAGQAYQGNQLLMQGRQLDLSNAEGEQVGRAAAGLLSLGDESAMAAAYPRVVGMLQSQGLAMKAPTVFPGKAALQSLVSQSVPVPDQIKMGLYTPPGLTDALGRSNAPLPGQPGYGGTTATPGTATAPGPIEAPAQARATLVRDGLIKRGMDPETATAFAANALHESAANPNTGPGDGGVSQGLFMWNGPRNTAYQQIYGHTPQGAPLDEQLDFVMHELNGPESLARDRINQAQGVDGKAAQVSEAYLRPKDTGPEMQRRSATALQLQRQLGGGGTPASYTVASNTPTPPPGSTASPGAPAVATAGASTATAPPAATPGVAQPPSSVGTGTNSPQFQAALELNRRATALEAQFPYSPAAKAQAASLRAQAALYMQADSVSVDPVTGIQTKQLSGERLNAAAPNARYEWDEGRGAYVDRTGTHPPVTPPSPRITMTPGGTAIQSKPGGGAEVVYQTPPTTPPTGSYDQQAKAYSGDIPTIKTISESGRAAQASALQLNELADVIKDVQSGGALPEFRAKVAALMEANGAKPETIEALTGMKSGTDAQVLQKLAVATIGASAKADLGSNVGVESLNVYANANPGLDKLQDANKRVTNMIRVARAQIDSYTMGAQQHFNQNQTSMLHTPQGQVPDYHPLSEFNQQWQAQNNPQIGAAAIGILNGDGFDKWAVRASPDEAMNAVRLAARIDPNVQIPVKGGGFKSAQEILSHGAGQ